LSKEEKIARASPGEGTDPTDLPASGYFKKYVAATANIVVKAEVTSPSRRPSTRTRRYSPWRPRMQSGEPGAIPRPNVQSQ